MEYDTNTTLEQIRQLNLTGNIIPHSWYSKIKFPSGTADLLGTVLLAEIVYWYRPVAIKDERTGQLVGYRKKFSADMLQRNLSSFAEQFGSNKRQISEALKRLEDAGLIIKKLRTIDTAMGVLNNVLFLAPVPSAIAALDENPKSDDFSDNAASEEEALNVPPTTIERSRGYVQTYHPLRSNVVGTPVERSTYTKNTTEITTKITAAQMPIAAAVFSKKIKSNNAEALISDVLTNSQINVVQDAARELIKFTTANSDQLTKEIEFAILSKTTFTNANRDFFKKLNTIKKMIKKGHWNTPAGMIEKKESEQKKVIDPIKHELTEAELDCAHWQKMIRHSLEKGKKGDVDNFKNLLKQAQKKVESIKSKFFDAASKNKTCSGI